MVAQLDGPYLRQHPLRAARRVVSWCLFEGRPATTRGAALVNPLVFSLAWLAKRLPATRAVRSPIFIVGTGRSGTTSLGVALSLHRSVGFLNEPKALWHAACPGQDVIGSYDRAPGRLRLSESDASEEVLRSIRRLYGAYLALTGTQRVLDKYPEMIFRTAFLRRLFPDARILLTLRDGWSTSRSIAAWSDRHARNGSRGSEDWWGVDGRKWQALIAEAASRDPELAPHQDELGAVRDPLQRAAIEWTLTQRVALGLLERSPEWLLSVRCEELARDPRSMLERVLRFCELEPEEAVLRRAERTPVPARTAEPFELLPCLRPAFERARRELGYLS